MFTFGIVFVNLTFRLNLPVRVGNCLCQSLSCFEVQVRKLTVSMASGAKVLIAPIVLHDQGLKHISQAGWSTKYVIGTHDGTFHCDDVAACTLLKFLPEYKNSVIVRTRREELLNTFEIVVDVGGEYDPSKARFDHHQRTFSESMHSLNPEYPWETKLSSSGLVYYHYGKRILSEMLKLPVESDEINSIYRVMYTNFFEEIDAIDNGIDPCDHPARYSINTHLSMRVKFLNPTWNTKGNNEIAFTNACSLVRREFVDRVVHYHEVWWPAREIVRSSIRNQYKHDPKGEIIELDRACPWKEHLHDLEEEYKMVGHIKFVLYPDENGAWRVQAVPIHSTSFKNRVSLKSEWCGLRGEKLNNVSGIKDATFVHANGFIGGNENKAGAVLMAVKSNENLH